MVYARHCGIGEVEQYFAFAGEVRMALPGYKSNDEIKDEYPLHWSVWQDDPVELDELLASKLVRNS